MRYKNNRQPYFLEVLCGVSNSGKSTYLKEKYPNGFDGIVISRDELVMQYGRGDTYNECWQSLTKELHHNIDNKINDLYIDALQNKRNIIIDMTNLTKNRRALWFNRLPSDYISRTRVFITPLNVIKKRNSLQKGSKFIPEKVLDEMKSRFEHPLEDEADEIVFENAS